MPERVTGITVCYNTVGLLRDAYESVRKFYPNMQIVIVDNSVRTDPCAAYVGSLASDRTRVVVPGKNIGHGPGMNLGIKHAKTRYALIFDSDIVLLENCLPQMLALMKDNSFGVGEVMSFKLQGARGPRQRMAEAPPSPTAATGFTKQYPYRLMTAGHHGRRPGPPPPPPRHIIPFQPAVYVPYLHPRFHLINVENYGTYRPYMQHGAPCLGAMIDISERGLSAQILIDFPIERYVQHVGRGTRRIYPHWAQIPWEAV